MFGFGRKSKQPEVPARVDLPVEKVDRETALRQLIDLDFPGCVKAYANAESGSTLEKLAFDKIKKTGRTFDEFLMVYDAVAVTPAGSYALEKMMANAKTFKEWQQVREHSRDANSTSLVIAKLASLAKTREELIYVFIFSLPETIERIMMKNALCRQIKTIEEWEAVAESALGSEEMRKFAVDMMVELITCDIKDLNDLLLADVIRDSDEFKNRVLDKIRVLALTSDEWFGVIADDNMDNEVKEVALEKLIADPTLTSRGFKDWEKLFDEAEEGSKFERHAALMMIDKIDPNDPDAIASLANSNIFENDQDLFGRIIEKIRIAVVPFKKWKEAYENFDDSGIGSSSNQIVGLVFLRMVESITNIEELIEADEVIDDDDLTDDEKEKFGARADLIIDSKQVCQRIINEYYADAVFFEKAVVWLVASAKTTEECVDLFFASLEDWKTSPDDGEDTVDVLVEKTRTKLLEVATDAELCILSKFPDDDFGDIADEASKRLDQRESLKA